MSRRRGPWRWLLIPLLLVLSLPAALFALLASEGGTEWVLRQASELARPTGFELDFDRSTGSLSGRLELFGLRISGNDARVQIDRLLLDWRPRALLQRHLHVRALEIAGVRLIPPPADDSPPQPLQIPDLQLPVALQVDRLILEDLLIDRPDSPLLIERLVLTASLDDRGLELRDLDFAGAGARLQGELSMQASAPHAIDGRLTARVGRELSGDAIGAVTAEAGLSGPALRPVVDLVLDEPARLNLRGGLVLDSPQPGFDLTVDWDELNWPLQGEPQLTARAGHLALKGALDDYRISLDTVLHSGELAPGKLALQGQGDLQGLMLEPLTLRVADGSLRAEGALRWDDGLRWEIRMVADGLDPGLLLAEWPGAISGRLGVQGSLDAAGEQVVARARIDSISGRLRGHPVSASGALDWDAGQLSVDALKLASGPNRIEIDGRVDERVDLRFAIEAPQLAALYPGLRGRLQGAGQLGGTPTQPTVTAQLSGGDLDYQDLSVRRLAIEVDWHGEGGKGRVRLADLDLAGVALGRVEAALDGSPADHRLVLDADGPDFGVALKASGGLQAQRWTGQLRHLTLRQAAMGEWRLRKPSALQVAADEVRSGRLCLTQGRSEACATGGWSRVRGLDLSGSLQELRLAKLAAFAPGEAKVQGSLSADFSAQGPIDAPRLVFDLRPSLGRIRLEDRDQRYDLVFRNARINGQFENDRGSLDLRFDLAENGRAEGRVTLGALQAGERALGGEVRMDFPDLALVEGFVPALDDVEGRVDLHAKLGGTLSRPRVAGRLSVHEAGALVREAGIRVRDIALDIQGDHAGTLNVEGRANSGEGRVAIAGTVDLAATGGPTVDLSVSGQDFEAVRLPEATVALSPDLRLQGQGPYHLSGTLRIPSAAIRIKSLPRGMVEVSPDEVVVGETETPTAAEQAVGQSSLLTARVRVELGDAVNFDGFGLTTRLVGKLDAVVDARSTTLDGRIDMRNARYEAYGQNLEVELGRLLFAGPPGNPSVDLRAVRESFGGDVKAYLALSGPLAEPRARVYSEPALPEAEALAYLLTGRGLDQADRQQGVNITSAALAFGLARGEPLLQKMSGRLGLDELRVESGAGGLQESSLVLGKYLNPNLYLGYSQGLFSPEGAVLLRVRLSERLEFESRSGTEQTFDLLFRIEHN